MMTTFESSLFRGLEIVQSFFGATYSVASSEYPEYGQLDRMNATRAAYDTLVFLWGLSDRQERRLKTCYRAYCKYCLKFYEEPSPATYRQMAAFIKAG